MALAGGLLLAALAVLLDQGRTSARDSPALRSGASHLWSCELRAGSLPLMMITITEIGNESLQVTRPMCV